MDTASARKALAWAYGLIVACTGCTPNAAPAQGGNQSLLVPPGAAVQVVDVNLGANPPLAGTFGVLAGYAPNPSTVAVGSVIVFHNSEGFAHTASVIAGSSFPAANPLGVAALQASGSRLTDAGWSSGTLAPGASSQALTADAPGIFLYGCFYHYNSPMRGAIVVH